MRLSRHCGPAAGQAALLTAGGPASPPLATCSAEVFLEVEMGGCFLVPLSSLQTPSVIPLLRSGAPRLLGLKALLVDRPSATVQPMELGHGAGEGGLWFLLLTSSEAASPVT